VFKAYTGAYWKQCITESDRYDDGNIQGRYPDPVTALHSWLDGLIEYEVIQLRAADDLAERMGNTSLGGSMALLNEKASQRKPPVKLEWEESEEGRPHKKTFNATLKSKHPRYCLYLIETYSAKYPQLRGKLLAGVLATRRKRQGMRRLNERSSS
jgi:hypothetical protein